MSAPAYVVVPVDGDATHTRQQKNIEGAKIASAIQRSINQEIHPQYQHVRHAEQGVRRRSHQEHNGPLKAMLDNRRRFYYKYISWDDPLRTLCSYLGVLSILIIAHYMPFTHLALKAGAITLGLTAAMEFASRTFGPDTFLTRLRPKPYKTIPEDTLNATLKDIHDLIQFSVREAQKIVFAQELDKTLLTSVALGSAYFLSRALSPFSFSVLALTTIYIGSLAASSVPSDTGRVQNIARRATGDAMLKPAQPVPGSLTGSGTSRTAHPAPEYPVTLKEEHNEHQPHVQSAHSPAPAHSSTPPGSSTPPPPPLVTGYAAVLKEEPLVHQSESGLQQRHQFDTTAGVQHQFDTTTATSVQHKPQHQRRASGQELRETNFSHRRVGSRGSADGPGSPTSPTKPFASSIPVATTLNGGYRHGASNW